MYENIIISIAISSPTGLSIATGETHLLHLPRKCINCYWCIKNNIGTCTHYWHAAYLLFKPLLLLIVFLSYTLMSGRFS